MHVLLQPGRDDVLDDLLPQKIVPVILDFLDPLIHSGLLIVLHLLGESVLFLDKLGDLVFVV